MKTILLVMVLAGASSAQAADYYGALLGYFDQGTLPTQTVMEGKISGRCYYPALRDLPSGGMLETHTVPADSGNGPLFPPGTAQVVQMQLWTPPVSLAPDYFDEGNVFNGGISVRTDNAQIINNSWVARHIDGGYELQVRQYQNYLILKEVRLKAVSSGRAGEPNAVCYFFKKLPPDPS